VARLLIDGEDLLARVGKYDYGSWPAQHLLTVARSMRTGAQIT
jgi:hypothetical protein